MSGLGEAMKGIKQLLLLQEDVRRLDRASERQEEAFKSLAKDFIALDKRVIRIETMIEMTAGRGSQPRIEGN